MIAQRLSPDVRWVVAGAPAYLDRFGTPQTPHDLKDHRCLRNRLGDERIYRWEFMENGTEFDLAVPGMMIFDDTRMGLELLRGGAGLMIAAEPVFAPLVEAGEARLVLEDWATSGPGYQMYYSGRRQVPAGLRLLIELIREMKPMGA